MGKKPVMLYVRSVKWIFKVSDSLKVRKMPKFSYFERLKRPFFTQFPGISYFYDFQILSDLCFSKIVPGPFLSFFDGKLPQKLYHAAQTLNLQFDLSLTSWPWMILTLSMLIESLGWYLEVSQTRSMLYCLFSIWHGCSARQNPMQQIVKHFGFDLTCVTSSVAPRWTTLGFPR